MPLLEQSRIDLEEGRCHVIEFDGVAIRMYDDAATALTVIKLFADEGVQEPLKFRLLFEQIFPNPQGVIDAVDDLDGLIIYCVKELCGLDVSKERTPDDDVIDWEQDEAFIKASVWNAYGIDFNALAKSVTYQELCQLLSLVPHETPMGQAIYYRTAKEPKPTKYNKEEIKDFRKRKKFWALKRVKEASGDRVMTGMFDALAKKVKANG